MSDVDTLIDDLRRLVEVESPSHDTDALTASAGALAALLEQRTGRPAVLVEGPAGPHVHWSGGAASRVLILGHHDTVFPLGTLATRPFRVERRPDDIRATGPGVFDMKGGIVQAVHAVAALPPELAAQVEMLFTSDEEVGAGTSRGLLEQRAVACGNVLVLEPSADGGAVKTARKGGGTFEVVIRGRAAHAGLEPENGRNALVEAAHQVLAISRFGAPEFGTTVTPTVAHAGTADNVVPAEARIRVDVRVMELSEGPRVEQAMRALVPVTPDVTIEVLGRVGRPPMPADSSATLYPLAEAVQPGIGGVAVGGSSDGNFTAALGVPTLDGLGAIGGGAHADHEWIDVAAMPARVSLLEGILRRILE